MLAGLALRGLLLSPPARPAKAVESGAMAQGDMAAHAAMDVAGMPCCPDDTAKPDCAKDCPLMALCMAKMFQNAPQATCPVISTARARIGVLANDASLNGFAPPPLPRPPDA